MKKTAENSQQQAEIIKMIAVPIMMLDEDYCRELANDMVNQANRQESIAVLNPRHPQSKNEVLRTQGKALLLLCEYVKTLKEVEKLKQRVLADEKNMADISRMFM